MRSSTLKVGPCFVNAFKYLILLYFMCMAFEMIIWLSMNIYLTRQPKTLKKRKEKENKKQLVNDRF